VRIGEQVAQVAVVVEDRARGQAGLPGDLLELHLRAVPQHGALGRGDQVTLPVGPPLVLGHPHLLAPGVPCADGRS
jgi:hypothetical protein